MSRWKKAYRNGAREELQLQAGGTGLATGLLVDVLCRRNRILGGRWHLTASFLLGGAVMWNHLGPEGIRIQCPRRTVREDLSHKLGAKLPYKHTINR